METAAESSEIEISHATCEFCLNSVSRSGFQEHMMKCKMKLSAECQFCKRRLTESEHRQHENICILKMGCCLFCSKWFTKSGLKRHQNSCLKIKRVFSLKAKCKKTSSSNNKNKVKHSTGTPISTELAETVCKMCKRCFSKGEFETHEQLCLQKMRKCQFCLNWFKIGRLKFHERHCRKNQPGKNQQSTREMTMCQFCLSWFELSGLKFHQQSCPKNQPLEHEKSFGAEAVCKFCKKCFSKGELKTHEQLCLQKMGKCQFCLNWFKLGRLKFHERRCPKNQLENEETWGVRNKGLPQTGDGESLAPYCRKLENHSTITPSGEELQNSDRGSAWTHSISIKCEATSMSHKSEVLPGGKVESSAISMYKKLDVTPIKDQCKKMLSRKKIREIRQVINKKYRPFQMEKPLWCILCNIGFSKSSDLKRHNARHRYFCRSCYQTFEGQGKLDDHKCVNSNFHRKSSGYFACNSCKKIFSTLGNMRRHQAVHRRTKTLSCPDCNKKFSKEEHLKQHQLIHLEKKPFLCTLCNIGFIQKILLRRHVVSKHQYRCLFCCRAFQGQPELDKHECQEKNKKFLCNLCKKGFTRYFSLKEHNRRQGHQYVCSFCCQPFEGQEELDKHITISKHPKRMVNSECDVCKRVFSHQRDLKKHLVIHQEYTPFTCDICNRRLYNKTQKEEHMLVMHYKKKTVAKCPHCNWKYTGEVALLQAAFAEHKESCVNKKKEQFSCTICRAEFTYERTLQHHMRAIHGKLLFYYACTLCKAQFLKTKAFLSHMQIHSKPPSAKCKEITKEFAEPKGLSIQQNSTQFPDTINNESDFPTLNLDGNVIVIQPEPQSYTGERYHAPNIQMVKPEPNPDMSDQYDYGAKVKSEPGSVATPDITISKTMLVKSEPEIFYFDSPLDWQDSNIEEAGVIKSEYYHPSTKMIIKSESYTNTDLAQRKESVKAMQIPRVNLLDVSKVKRFKLESSAGCSNRQSAINGIQIEKCLLCECWIVGNDALKTHQLMHV